MASTPVRCSQLGGVAQQKEVASIADVYLRPPLESFSLFEYKRGEEIARIGYEFALKELRSLGDALERPHRSGAA